MRSHRTASAAIIAHGIQQRYTSEIDDRRALVDCSSPSGDDAATPGSSMARDIRIGHGFDAHRFRRGRKLMLGGIEIPHDRGLAGHSDADAVLHALMNAMLGALSEGDIGSHFPDHVRAYKNIASAKLLKQVLGIVQRRRFKLINADITVVAEQPKLSPHYAAMRRSIAAICGIPANRISVKAATTEKMGWTGRGQGLAALAVVLLGR